MTRTNQLRIAAVGLVIGPFLFTLGDLFRRMVTPDGTFTDVQLVRAVADHPGAWSAASLLSALGAICFLPGAVALFATARGRGVGMISTGAALLTVGLIASIGHGVGFYDPFARYADSHASAATITSMQNAGGDPTVVLWIVLFIIGVMLGSIVLLIGLRRARRVPVWAVVAVIVFVACGSSGGVAPGIVGILAALAAFAPSARTLATRQPPRVEGNLAPESGDGGEFLQQPATSS